MSQQRIKAESDNHALAMGRFYINRDPLYVLKGLEAGVCYSPAVGYYIPLGHTQQHYAYKTLLDCLKFHSGAQN